MSKQAQSPFDFSKLVGNVDPSEMMEKISKALTQYQMPGVDAGALLDSQRKNVEALTTANKQALEGVQSVLSRQGEMLREAMEEAQTVIKDLSASGSAGEAASKQGELLKTAFEKAVTNMRELAEMTAKSNTAAFDTINQRVSESMQEVKSLAASLKK
jgi:phasin family protein